MTDFYSRIATAFEAITFDLLYTIADGTKIEWDGVVTPEVQDLLDRDIADIVNDLSLTAAQCAEMSSGNLIFPGGVPTLAGEKQWGTTQPTEW